MITNYNKMWIPLTIILVVILELKALPHNQGRNHLIDKTSRTKRETDVIFADDEVRIHYAPKNSTICAKRSTFCENSDEEYPEKLINFLLSRESKKYEALFGADLVIPEDDIQNRFSGNIDEETLCTSTEELVYPKEGETKDGDWLYIVNTKNYQQGVRIELCSRQNDRCAFSNNFPNGYESKCVQKYIYRELLGLDRQGNTGKITFKLPSCCQCILTHSRSYE